MLHGLSPQSVLFERRNVAGTWRLVTHGDNVGAGVFYHTETPTEVVVRLADPAYYFVCAQVLTGNQTTRLELKNPTAGLPWAARQWTRTNFPQINTLTHAGTATVDPTFTILNRAFAPYMHAGANWLVNTTAADQFLQLEIVSGVPIAQQPLLLNVWKLHNTNESTTQQPNALLAVTPSTSAGALFTSLTTLDDRFWSVSRDASRFRVTANAGTTNGLLTFSTSTTDPTQFNYCFGGTFTHDLIVRIASHEGETVTGNVRVVATRQGGAVVVNSVVSYGPTQSTSTFSIPAGAPIATVQLQEIDAADRFEIEVLLNVTN